MEIHLKVAELRKNRNITQQELADAVGVSCQAVSKWETQAAMPDIGMLPELTEYFQVTVDQLLGLKPLAESDYIPVRTGEASYWSGRLDYLKRTRDYFWNTDYLRFLIGQVWKITKPVDMLDCGCGYGFRGALMLPLLPEGSSYTGIDISEKLLEEGGRYFNGLGLNGTFICEDIHRYRTERRFGLTVCQAVLRHSDDPFHILEHMADLTEPGGLVVCADVNREFECDGIYIEGLDYAMLCERHGFRKMWKTELEKQGRDYSVAMKVPHELHRLGLTDIGVRMNDKVTCLNAAIPGHKQSIEDFCRAHNWERPLKPKEAEELIGRFMNHGMDRREAEAYLDKQRMITEYLADNEETAELTHVLGMLIAYGRKAE